MLFILTNVLMLIQLPVLLFGFFVGGVQLVFTKYTVSTFLTINFSVLDLICEEQVHTSRLLHTSL